MKKILGIMFLAIIIIFLIIKFSLVYMGQNDKKSRKKFGSTFMTLNNPFFVELNEGIKEVIENNGDKLVSLDPQLNVDKQIAEVEDLISQKVDGIFLNPIDWYKIKPALEAANKANIPVFIVDAPVFYDDLVVTTIASDNWNAGILCAKHLTETLKITEGNIVIIEHPSAKSAVERTDSFLKEISKYPKLKIIAKESSEGQLEIAMLKMKKILEKNKNITAVMALNDPSALGVIAALESAGRLKEVKAIYGIDGSIDGIKLIKAGKLTATVVQYPKKIGKIAAESAYKYLKGESVEKEIKVPVKLVGKKDL